MYHHRGTSLKLSVYVSSCVARCRMSLFLMSYYFWLDYIDMFKLAQPHFRWIRCLHSTHAVFLTLGKPLSYASLNIVIGWAVMIGCWASCFVSDWPIMNVSILHRHAWACLRLKYHALVDIYMKDFVIDDLCCIVSYILHTVNVGGSLGARFLVWKIFLILF